MCPATNTSHPLGPSIFQTITYSNSSRLPDNALSDEECFNLLFLTDPAVDRDRLIQAKGQRAHQTCEWVTSNERSMLWRNGTLRSLWIRGTPGKGKTMISIFLSEYLETEKCIYYFCIAADAQRNTATAVLRGLLWQLNDQNPELRLKLEAWFLNKRHAEQMLLSAETLWKILVDLTMSQSPQTSSVFWMDWTSAIQKAKTGWQEKWRVGIRATTRIVCGSSS